MMHMMNVWNIMQAALPWHSSGEADASLLSGNTLPVAMLCVLLFDRQLAQAQEVGAHNNKNTLLNHEPIHEGQQQQQ